MLRSGRREPAMQPEARMWRVSTAINTSLACAGTDPLACYSTSGRSTGEQWSARVVDRP